MINFAKVVQKTITKNGCTSRGTVVFWSLNLQKMDQFCKSCPKNHYKKRLYLPRDSRFLEYKSSKNKSILQNLSKTPLQKTAVSPAGQSFFGIYWFFSYSFCNITTLWCDFNKLITNLNEFYIFQYKQTVFFQKKRLSLLKMDKFRKICPKNH